MITVQQVLTVTTRGRGTLEITDSIRNIVRESGVGVGLAHVFVHHTSASLILCENADPTVRRDLETFMTRLAPDGASWLEHDDEGPDDMPAHIRTILTQSSLAIPVTAGRCALGVWQGIYLWEHRRAPHSRRITVTVQGHERLD
ncbi:MAG TPA: secondary thiamine-phosphate synthase enzyme YjbQ [Candidatus Competibacteraceae bacterium]|nr:MAG: YjbQ family protein [Candidatus Competibacteraceae bacterium]HOB62449.1 secondary thiamine-phosphate synthase enzyme YjbQ [Candidatus Competibacteraceae bacterium]HQA26135.1 secondary thiamine-phosphate synthase enzyme YjbQ [Candidatus Competibacteraceae bacterium]HQD55803.1 secondary thiamine-phosphate synthase enzyme YjbQ [Candidatus Competibacteraceae bacterium]